VLLWREHDTTFEDAASRCCRVRTEKSGADRQIFHLLPGSQIPRLRGSLGRGGVASWVHV